jgi:DNA topoisomerase II
MNQKSITEFLSNEYKEFALYSIEGRAIPSVIDGFKPTQRKILHIANQVWKTGSEKNLKVFQLSGKVASDAFYHHGDMSLSNAIINLAQKFKNNAPLLEEDGQFGSLRSPQPGAPRYIGTKLSPNFRLMYKDFDLLEYKEEEGEKIEPKFFLPIIPTVLINGGSGIAVGFASNILNRDIREIIESCVKCINSKKISTIKPSLTGFTGEYIQDKENNKKWYIRGRFEKVNTSTIKIVELPPSMTYEKYEEILDKLVENKEIVSYEDNCKDNIDYTIKFTRANLESLDDTALIKLLKLEESETENFNTLDENGKLKIFESVEDIIQYFINFRLKYYQLRKDFELDKLHHELKVLGNRGKFIKNILDGKIIVNNKSKDEIVSQIESIGLEQIDDSYDYLLRMPIYSLTKEMFEKLKEDFSSKKEEIEKLKLVDPKDMYISDLSDLKKKFK